jgi:hypothetical protein
VAHLKREIIVIFDEGAVRHLHRRMVGTQFVKEHVERDGVRALFGQFRNEPAINFARPVEAEMKADAAVFHGGDAGFLDGDEGEVGGGGRGKMQRGPRSQVIGHPLQPLEKIQPRQPQAANKREDGEGQKDRRAFEGFEFHRAGLNKKPEQLKAALATLKDSGLPDVKVLSSPASLQHTINQNGHDQWPRSAVSPEAGET